MIDERLAQLRIDAEPLSPAAADVLSAIGFVDVPTAWKRLRAIRQAGGPGDAALACLHRLLLGLWDSPTPDRALVGLERYFSHSSDPAAAVALLNAQPRAVEMLIKLFVGSQYLTETLLRSPESLSQLVQPRWLADLRSREEFFADALSAARRQATLPEQLDALRRFQRSEILRIGACDAFALMDLRAATVQLSLLADSLVEAALELVAAELGLADRRGFSVLGLGKLGGEELNYSSDIDLVLLAADRPERWIPLAQQLVRALQNSTAEGFLYRVDLRLRPWGRSGALVTTVDGFLDYLHRDAELWEKQALLKARIVAGDPRVGRRFIASAQPLIFGHDPRLIRDSVRAAKSRIEAGLKRRGKDWGEVKSGSGSIRDVEFVTQYLQLLHGDRHPQLRTPNTLDALVRLADQGLLHADEYRRLTGGYTFLRTIEHALQLMHNTQEHQLPTDRRELDSLARRLDFPGADEFLVHYERHCAAIRQVYERRLGDQAEAARLAVLQPAPGRAAEPADAGLITPDDRERHLRLLRTISAEHPVRVVAAPVDGESWRVTVLGVDHSGDLSIICGLLFVYGFDIVAGLVTTGEHPEVWDALPDPWPSSPPRSKSRRVRDFVNVFVVRPPCAVVPEVWINYEADLTELMLLVRTGAAGDAQGRLAKRVAAALEGAAEDAVKLAPVEVQIENAPDANHTVLQIRADDTIGFLYELCNALALSGLDIDRMVIRSEGNRVCDTLHVTDAQLGGPITSPQRQQELRAAVVLIKHFTHLLPKSPNPEAALLHFRSFLRDLFAQPNWLDELSSLDRPDVLDALAQLLGVSDFLWDDFLRLQYANLFPLLKDVSALRTSKPRAKLQQELAAELARAGDAAERIAVLNAFKDREMFRVDMRHILGHVARFDAFAAELTDVAEAVVGAAVELAQAELSRRYGTPRQPDGRPVPLAVCALGKCGGRELGFASDIELLFVYGQEGATDGRQSVSTATYFQRLVERFTQLIQARREGIFHIDLRLRPYGRAGQPAVSLDAFRHYFGPEGAAWPYERQALVKLRPIAGDPEFGQQVVALRDALIYTSADFDCAALHAMRERQLQKLVRPGTFQAKLSPGGLVDVEYLVQSLQIRYGDRFPALRAPSTSEAAEALCACGLLPPADHQALQDAYTFLRRLIDALRMVRGDARDLTVPPSHSDEFEFLARRLGYGGQVARLQQDLERHVAQVTELFRRYVPTTESGTTAVSSGRQGAAAAPSSLNNSPEDLSS